MNPFRFLKRKKDAPAAEPRPPVPRRWLSRTIAEMFKASYVRDDDNWGGTPISPDVFISLRQPVLVARSREQWSNNDYARAFVRLCRQNIVGPHGVILQAKARKPRGGYDKEANAAIEAAWQDFSQRGNCDVTGQLSLTGLQRLAVETAARDGEFIFRKIYGDDAGPHKIALQAVDPQRLSVKYENYKFGNNGHFIRHGIEFNRYGKPVAYHFTSLDEWDAYYYSINGKGFVRVPASEVIHGFVHEMVGQRRGLPWYATSLFRLHHLAGFEDASVQNARASASKMGFVQWREGFGPECEEGDDVAGSIEAAPLSIHELPEGAEWKDFNPNYPNGEFDVFGKAMLRGAAAGMGVQYHSLTGDLTQVNFSSIRSGTLDEREVWKELQEWLVETMLRPLFDDWLKIQLLAGSIKMKNGRPLPPDRLDALKCVKWQPRRWQWIDPMKDVQASLESIRGGLSSPGQVIREQGRDPETVFAEFAEDLKEMKAAGIPDEIIHLFMTGEPPKPEPSQPEEPPKKEDNKDG